MNDLANSLRLAAQRDDSPLYAEAADEIERLQCALEEISDRIAHFAVPPPEGMPLLGILSDTARIARKAIGLSEWVPAPPDS